MGREQEADLHRNLFKSFFIGNKADSVYSRLKIGQCFCNHLLSVLRLIKAQLGVEQRDHQPVICLGLTKVPMAKMMEGSYLETGGKIVLRFLKKKKWNLKEKNPWLDLSSPHLPFPADAAVLKWSHRNPMALGVFARTNRAACDKGLSVCPSKTERLPSDGGSQLRTGAATHIVVFGSSLMWRC